MNLSTALNRISKGVVETRNNQKTNSVQRRNAVVDQYGYEFHRQGSVNKPAQIGISISPDLIYYERFEFKIILADFSYYDGRQFVTTPSQAVNLRISIEGIDMTPYFATQYNGTWISGGAGIYPNSDRGTYDVLKACGLMSDAQRKKVLAPGYKKIVISADGPFDVTLVNYLKYSHINR